MVKRWFVVQSFFGSEFKIEHFLKDKIKHNKMDCYFGRIMVPTEDVLESRNGKKIVVKKKLYPGYVLIEMEMCEESLDLVRYLPHVLRFVGGTSEEPWALTVSEIANIFSRITETTRRPRPKIIYNVGELVRIISGPFSDFNGTVESVDYIKSKLKVAVLIFGRSTPIELDFDHVEKS